MTDVETKEEITETEPKVDVKWGDAGVDDVSPVENDCATTNAVELPEFLISLVRDASKRGTVTQLTNYIKAFNIKRRDRGNGNQRRPHGRDRNASRNSARGGEWHYVDSANRPRRQQRFRPERFPRTPGLRGWCKYDRRGYNSGASECRQMDNEVHRRQYYHTGDDGKPDCTNCHNSNAEVPCDGSNELYNHKQDPSD